MTSSAGSGRVRICPSWRCGEATAALEAAERERDEAIRQAHRANRKKHTVLLKER